MKRWNLDAWHAWASRTNGNRTLTRRPLRVANQRRARHRGVRDRTGAAILELVLAFPLVLFMSFGLVEFGQYLYVRHCFEAATRDAARVAIMQNGTQSQVTTTLTNTLAQANVTYNSSWLTITDLGPSTTGTVTDVSTVPLGDQLQFTLSATYSTLSNALRPLSQYTGVGISASKTVSGICTMVKE